MRIIIRQSVFETNSSSVHSIVISKNPVLKYDPLSLRKVELGIYGWKHRILSTPPQKLDYLWTSLYCFYSPDKTVINQWKNYLIDVLELPSFVDFGEYDSYDYDDNEDYAYLSGNYWLGEFHKQLKENPDLLRRLIYNDDSFIQTGNDNEHSDDEIIFSGIGYGELLDLDDEYQIYRTGN